MAKNSTFKFPPRNKSLGLCWRYGLLALVLGLCLSAITPLIFPWLDSGFWKTATIYFSFTFFSTVLVYLASKGVYPSADLAQVYTGLLQDNHLYVALLDRDGQVLYVSRSLLNIGGGSVASVTGTPVWEIPWFALQQDNKAQLKDDLVAAVNGERIRSIAVCMGAEGIEYHLDYSMRLVSSDNNRDTCILFEARDVSYSVRKKLALQEEIGGMILSLKEADLYKRIFQESTCATLLFDDGGKCISGNQSAAELLGYTVAELESLTWEKLFSDINQYEKFAAELSPVSFQQPGEDMVLLKKSAETLSSLVSRRVIYHGQQQFVSLTISDNQEFKALEKELLCSHKLEALGTLASGLAHDYNNILSAIFGYTQLAKMNFHNQKKQEKALNGIYKATSRAKELVNQIFTFSRKGKNEKSLLQLSILTKEVMKFLRQSFPATVEMEISIDSDRLVLMDPSQIHQVYVNLCTNGYQAMGEQGVLTSKLYDVSMAGGDNKIPDGEYVCVEISDTGGGIDEDTRARIFDPYFSTRRKAEGRGLGLAVVHGIVIEHGGYIFVSSEKGLGTTFTVYLPTVDKKNELEKPPAIEMETLQGYEHVLLVDDDAAILNVTSRVMQRNGYRVSSCLNGAEALELFLQAPDDIDIVVTDLTMPKMTGVELVEKILIERKEIPIIMSSGNREQLNDEKVTALGITEFIEKPYHIKQLMSVMRQIMD